jgi:four helix bundle protein
LNPEVSFLGKNIPMIALRDSPAWHRALDLSISIHRIIKQFPPQAKQRDEGLSSRLLHAAVRVGHGLADSFDLASYNQYDMLRLARYHLSETEFLLDCSMYMGYVEEQEYGRIQEEMRQLRGLINREIHPIHGFDERA